MPANRANHRAQPPKNLVELVDAIVGDPQKTTNTIMLVRCLGKFSALVAALLSPTVMVIVTRSFLWAMIAVPGIGGLSLVVACVRRASRTGRQQARPPIRLPHHDQDPDA
jgi:hypothetical protein